jgi:hypothetical protein
MLACISCSLEHGGWGPYGWRIEEVAHPCPLLDVLALHRGEAQLAPLDHPVQFIHTRLRLCHIGQSSKASVVAQKRALDALGSYAPGPMPGVPSGLKALPTFRHTPSSYRVRGLGCGGGWTYGDRAQD